MAFENKVVNGTDFALKVDGHLIGCATSHSIEITNSPRTIACKDSGDWENTEYGKFSWTASVDAFVNFAHDESAVAPADRQGYENLVALMVAKTKVEVISEYDQDGDGTNLYKQTGTAIITGVSMSAPDADNVTYSLSLQGTGALVPSVVES